MKSAAYFFTTIVLTVLATRVGVAAIPELDIKVFDVVVHHFWFGVALLLAGMALPLKTRHATFFMKGVGLGLIVDQAVFLALGGGKDAEYWSGPSTAGAMLLLLLLFLLRRRVAVWFGADNSRNRNFLGQKPV